MNLLPQFRKLSIVALLLSGVFLLDSCVQDKPGCGSKRDHRRRKKSVKKFAPSMSYKFVQPTNQKNSFWA
jgi:hypothetical protein